MKSTKKMYEDMTNAPQRPSLGHSTKKMDMANKMFGGKPAKESEMKSRFKDGCIYTAEMGPPPQDIDGGSAPSKKSPKKPAPKKAIEMAKGGAVRGDGCASKGKTRGRMV